MATTTTNFGWDIPQSTDLVKDGATAIAALGQDIDTALVDLKGGTTGQVLAKASGTDLDFSWVAQDDSNAIQNAIVDAKGDLIAATAADTPARLAVGTNGQVLTADSTASTGLKWATPASGGMTLLSTTTLSSSTTTITFSADYTDILIEARAINCSTNSDVSFKYNSGVITGHFNGLINRTTTYALTTSWPDPGIGNNVRGSNTDNAWFMQISDYNSTGWKPVQSWASFDSASAGNQNMTSMTGFATAAAAITQIQIVTSSGTFAGGTVKVWGIK